MKINKDNFEELWNELVVKNTKAVFEKDKCHSHMIGLIGQSGIDLILFDQVCDATSKHTKSEDEGFVKDMAVNAICAIIKSSNKYYGYFQVNEGYMLAGEDCFSGQKKFGSIKDTPGRSEVLMAYAKMYDRTRTQIWKIRRATKDPEKTAWLEEFNRNNEIEKRTGRFADIDKAIDEVIKLNKFSHS